MIDYVYGGEFLNVTSSKGATPYINSSQPVTGMLSYDGSSQSMKVFDGHTWQTLGGGSAMVNLSPEAVSALKWAQDKMRQEQELKILCEKHPTIKDIVDRMNITINEYQDKIEMVKTLLKEEEKIGTS